MPASPDAGRRAPAMTHVIAGEERHRLTAITGVAALGLDALASCAYGPEAIVIALAAAGAAGIAFTLPVTAVIVALLGVLVLSYRQVIAAYPDGGGAYTVSRDNLGLRPAMVAAASLVVDYVLNVAVSVAAGVAALTSAFPVLLPWTVELCLGVLLVVAAINLRGVVAGGRAFALPAVVFVGSLAVLIVVGLARGAPLAPLPAVSAVSSPRTVGILLLLAAFASGCSALTGIEAIANATPSFRQPRRARARTAEAGLGIVLGALLLGLAVRSGGLRDGFHLVEKHRHRRGTPRRGRHRAAAGVAAAARAAVANGGTATRPRDAAESASIASRAAAACAHDVFNGDGRGGALAVRHQPCAWSRQRVPWTCWAPTADLGVPREGRDLGRTWPRQAPSLLLRGTSEPFNTSLTHRGCWKPGLRWHAHRMAIAQRQLVILRHAKSAWPDGIPDRQRPLAKRGRRDASATGLWLRDELGRLDAVLCSPAERARQTWARVAAGSTIPRPRPSTSASTMRHPRRCSPSSENYTPTLQRHS